MIKKIFNLLLSFALLLVIFPTKVLAENDNIYPLDTKDPFNSGEIYDVYVTEVDGELYIDYVIPYSQGSKQFNGIQPMGIGKCPSPTKTVYSKATKQELIDIEKKIDRNQLHAANIIAFILGLLHAPSGLLGSYMLGGATSILKNAIKDALYHRNKNNYTVRTKMKCEAVNMGSRGWIHKHKVESIYIY